MRRKFRRALTPRKRRHVRVRAKVSGTRERPRLNVFRSSAHIYAQVIDDMVQKTLVSATDIEETLGALTDLVAQGRSPRAAAAPASICTPFPRGDRTTFSTRPRAMPAVSSVLSPSTTMISLQPSSAASARSVCSITGASFSVGTTILTRRRPAGMTFDCNARDR